MISLALTVRQCDCPLSAASDAYDVAFVTPHWRYHRERSTLELRVLADAADRAALEQGLDVVRNHEETTRFELLAKRGGTGRARLAMGTTDVMGTVVDHGGYLTGPFENVDGSERWQIGFDDEAAADAALETLDNADDECELRSRRVLDPATVLEDVRAEAVGSTVLERARGLTPTERETLRRAVEDGYYDVPRSATLGDLADALDVSDPAVSKTLRRAERKLLAPTVSAVESARRRDRR
ncbi:Predicted DNA binding protein, contains HTH domain [Halobiforma haloterrestris]|uniref:Predicted DNA binding protein, contains HTH domain n=1 Tax=Natronobacterium haloterrestre TaxID=148448 RepID=A0A1I1G0U6_NATHA|nr:helix-turn-helix domain-containing protein [Halobiforma haloterrestris]SFC05155.1 Predicted DNA binding protein, contains HTH domain [Halobiforma haloterrestris]